MSKRFVVRLILVCGLVTSSLLLSLTLVPSPIACTSSTLPAISTRISWTDVKQPIDGFGMSGAFQAYTLMNFPEPARSQILDLLFSQSRGVGFSIIRNVINDGGQSKDSQSYPTIEPSPGVFQWTGDEGQIWFMNQAKQRGTTRFMSTVWSPPAWMKSNNSVTNGGSLLASDYQAYADYLAQYVQGYQSHFGISIYGISPANEPNLSLRYSSATWTSQDFDTFIANYLKPTFARDHVQAKVIMPEQSRWEDNLAQATLNDPVASSRVDIVAGHGYSGGTAPFTDAQVLNKHVWQTEYSEFYTSDISIADGLKWAESVHNFMTITNANAWNYWWGVEALGGSSTMDGQGLIGLNLSNNTYVVAKRLYTIGNYSRFIRPEYERINTTTNPIPGIYVSAYKDRSSGKFAIVAINANKSAERLNSYLFGFKTSTVTPYTTSATQDLQKGATLSPSNGILSASLPPQSVTTFTGIGTATNTSYIYRC